MIDRLVKIADAEVGTKEVGGNNCGPRIREYQSATNLDPAAWPWCAAFVDWSVKTWLADPASLHWLALKTAKPNNWRPKTAGAWDLVNWAQTHPNTVTILPDTARAQPGDIVVFDFSHCGIVAESKDGNLFTIEGNTNGAGTRESNTGDGVWRKVRRQSLARAFLRIHPSTA